MCRFGVQGSYQNRLAAMYKMRRDAASVNYPDEVWLDAFELQVDVLRKKSLYNNSHDCGVS